MTYCEAFYLKNLQSLITGNDTFRKLLFSASRHAHLAQGLLVTLSAKMEDMLRRRNNTPKGPAVSALQILNSGKPPLVAGGKSLLASGGKPPLVSGNSGAPDAAVLGMMLQNKNGCVANLVSRHQSDRYDNGGGGVFCNGNLPRAPGTPPRHMLIPGTLPRKPEIPPPAIPRCAQNTAPVVPPPR